MVDSSAWSPVYLQSKTSGSNVGGTCVRSDVPASPVTVTRRWSGPSPVQSRVVDQSSRPRHPVSISRGLRVTVV